MMIMMMMIRTIVQTNAVTLSSASTGRMDTAPDRDKDTQQSTAESTQTRDTQDSAPPKHTSARPVIDPELCTPAKCRRLSPDCPAQETLMDGRKVLSEPALDTTTTTTTTTEAKANTDANTDTNTETNTETGSSVATVAAGTGAAMEAQSAQERSRPSLPLIPELLLAHLNQSFQEHMHALKDAVLYDFELREVIGTGTFGRVQVCRCKKNHRYYAMKIMKKFDIVRLKQVEHINTEKRIMSNIRHPFIVNLYSSFQDDRHLYMLLEYANGGEIFTHLRRMGRFAPETARFYAAQIVLILEYLHSQDIVYRDLKPENLLLDSKGYLKITDFGFAKVVVDRTWTLCGTPEYLAPEIIQSKGHGKGVDWWALGVLIYEMLVGYPPFFDDHPFGVYEKILNGKIQFPSHTDPNAKDLIKRLLTADRTKRLGNLKGGADDLKTHKWFREFGWELLIKKELAAPIQLVVTGEGDTSNFERYPMPPEDHAYPQMDPFQALFRDF